MRAIFFSCVTVLGLALACQWCALSAGEKDKKSQKVTDAEIEKLVKQLGSSNGATREAATKRLRDLPSSRHYMRRNLGGKDLETRRRMEELIRHHARNEFKRRFAELAQEKAEASLDLIVELLLENRNDVSDDDWKLTVEIVTAIAVKLKKDFKKKLDVPDATADYLRAPKLVGEAVSSEWGVPGYRIIADSLRVRRPVGDSVVILSQGFESAESFARCVFLTIGDISSPGKSGAIAKSFLFSDGDVVCNEAWDCIIIARGNVRVARPQNCIVIEHACRSSVIKLFSLSTIGLGLCQDGTQLRVKSVLAGSQAERCGIKPGDVIHMEKATEDLASAFERQVRRGYAKETQCDLTIGRDGGLQKIVLPFAD